MKRSYTLILFCMVLVYFSSCSSSKNSVNSDDVYSGGKASSHSEYYNTANDNYVEMRVQNPDRWSYFDDYGYDYYGSTYGPAYPGLGLGVGFGIGYSPFYNPWYGGFGYYSPMSFYNSYYAWNSFYNPYYGGVIIVSGKNTSAPSYTRMSNFNPTAYSGRYYNSRPTTNFYNPNTGHSNFTHPYNSRPAYTPSYHSSPSNFNSGGGMRGGGFSRGR